MRKMNLQMFASGDNNNQSVRSFQPQFKALLQAVFAKQSYFGDCFGELEVHDGVKESENAFMLKTCDIPVVVGSYNTDEDCAFGDRSEGNSRFGEMTEVIYDNVEVPYAWNWAIHEGLDRFTVNNDLDAAVADRLDLQAQAKVDKFNKKQAAYLETVAEKEEELTALTADGVLAAFNDLAKYYTNIGAKGERIAAVCPDVYNIVVDHPLNTTSKNGQVDIAGNECTKFKGFTVRQIPDELGNASTGVVGYTYVRGCGKAFTGINTARTIEAIEFDGVELQGAGKAGEYVLPDNRAAIGTLVFQ